MNKTDNDFNSNETATEHNIEKELADKLIFYEDQAFTAGLKDQRDLKDHLGEDWKKEVKLAFSPLIDKLKKKEAELHIEDEANQAEAKKPHEYWIKHCAAEVKPALDKAMQHISLKYGQIRETLSTHHNKQAEAKERHDKFKRTHKNLPLKKGFLDGAIFFIGVCLLFTVVEASISFDVFDAMGLPNIFLSYGACFLLSVLMAVCCHLFGDSLSRTKKKKAFFSALGGALIVTFIIVLRANVDSISKNSDPVETSTISEGIIVNLDDNTATASIVPGNNIFTCPLPSTAIGSEETQISPAVLGLGNIIMLIIGLLLGERICRYRPHFEAIEEIADHGHQIDMHRANLKLEGEEKEGTKAAFEAQVYQKADLKCANIEKEGFILKRRLAGVRKEIEHLEQRLQNWIDMGCARIDAAFERGQANQ